MLLLYRRGKVQSSHVNRHPRKRLRSTEIRDEYDAEDEHGEGAQSSNTDSVEKDQRENNSYNTDLY